MRLSQREAAAVIAALERIDEERQRILDILYPDAETDEETDCPHPADQVEDRSTMGNEEYQCRLCGQTFDHHPSQSIQET